MSMELEGAGGGAGVFWVGGERRMDRMRRLGMEASRFGFLPRRDWSRPGLVTQRGFYAAIWALVENALSRPTRSKLQSELLVELTSQSSDPVLILGRDGAGLVEMAEFGSLWFRFVVLFIRDPTRLGPYTVVSPCSSVFRNAPKSFRKLPAQETIRFTFNWFGWKMVVT